MLLLMRKVTLLRHRLIMLLHLLYQRDWRQWLVLDLDVLLRKITLLGNRLYQHWLRWRRWRSDLVICYLWLLLLALPDHRSHAARGESRHIAMHVCELLVLLGLPCWKWLVAF